MHTDGSAKIFQSLANPNQPTLVQQIERELLRAVVEGQLPLGARVSESECARQMGISRAPLREAARLLEQRGLFVTKPGRGFYVRRYTVQELDDLYGLRSCLERFALAEAIHKASDTDLDRLQVQLSALGQAAVIDSRFKVVEEDIALHRALCACSGNARLARMFDDLAVDLTVLVSRLADLDTDPKIVAASHADWVNAAMARDLPTADRALEQHIRDGWLEMKQKADLL